VRPASHCNASVADVDGDDQALAELRGEVLERLFVRERGRADDDASCARGEKPLSVRQRADPSGRLYPGRCGGERRASHEVRSNPSSSGAVEVDHVNEHRACITVGLEERDGIGPAVRHRVVITAPEPNGIGTEDVDRGENHEPAPASVLLC